MTWPILLAKSIPRDGNWGDHLSLAGHLSDALSAADAILRSTADRQLRTLGLPVEALVPRFQSIVRISAAIHDLGKANSHFQTFIHEPFSNHRQSLRHEWVTALILDGFNSFKGWGRWLRPAVGSEEDWLLVRWAVTGHHPKYGRSAPPTLGEGPGKMLLQLGHGDIQRIAEWIASEFKLTGRPEMKDTSVEFLIGRDQAVLEQARRYYDDEAQFEDRLCNPQFRLLLGAVKNTLIAADVASSALPTAAPESMARAGWIAGRLGVPLPTGDAYRRIAANRLGCPTAELDERLKLRPFQLEVAQKASRVTLVHAGCGSGKTIAAYRWAAEKCADRRLYICYPTTGTALEGFKDYLLDPDLAEYVRTHLETSRADIDLAMEGIVEDRSEALARIESLDMWRRPVVACTVDAVLGVIQNNRRGMYAWPALSQAGFVFDEIHSFDDKLFDALLHFLTVVRGAPILLMTASLPNARRAAIETVLAEHGEALVLLPSAPIDLEIRPRYRIHFERKKTVRQALTDCGVGSRLVICNTVSRVMSYANHLSEAGQSPLIYHSRFKYIDRVERHKAVISGFKLHDNPIAVCSQVAEMSLDISASVLITELAPIPSLIQRLGRLNRKGNLEFGQCIVLEPLADNGKPSSLPYDADDLERAKDWLAKLQEQEAETGKPLSQFDLSQAWEVFDNARTPDRFSSAWLDFGPANPVLELREGAPNVSVLMKEDLLKVEATPKRLGEFVLPMPLPPSKVGKEIFEWQAGEFRGIPVVQDGAIDYEPLRGARWRERKEPQ